MGINEFSDGGKNKLDHTILNLVKTFNVNIILKPIDIGDHIPFVILHAQLKIMLKVKLHELSVLAQHHSCQIDYASNELLYNCFDQIMLPIAVDSI